MISFTIDGFQILSHREELESLAHRFQNFWAGMDYPCRLISATRRFSFIQKRQQLRNETHPLDDVRELIPILAARDPIQIQTFLRKRSATIPRALRTVHETPHAMQLLQLATLGTAEPDELIQLKEYCSEAMWRWPWLKSYRRLYEDLEQRNPPLAIHHYFVCWPDEYMDPQALRAVLKQTFLLPDVRVAPLPGLFQGRYREELTYLAPLDEGQPFLRVIHAYDVRGDWNIASFMPLLNQDTEIAMSIDIHTLDRMKAQRATTDAYNVLRSALFGKNAVKDARSERAFHAVEYAMARLDQQNLHEVAYAFLIQSPNLRALERQTQMLRDQMGARMRLDVLSGAQGEYLKLFTTQPVSDIASPIIRRNALSEHIAAKVPWGITKSDNIDGIMWGIDVFENMPVHWDLVGENGTDNGHFVVLGQPGTGKTVLLLTIALRLATDGYQVILIDPVGKCPWLCEAVGKGAVYNEVKTQASINILDPIDRDVSRQLGHVIRKLKVVLGQVVSEGNQIRYIPREMNNFETGAIDIAIRHEQIYGEHGRKLATMTAENAPLLSDLVDVLKTVNVRGAQDLADEISLRATGSYSHIYNTRTSIHWDFNSDVCAYNFERADKDLLPLYYDHMFASLDNYVHSEERKKRSQPLVVIIDEYGFMAQIKALHAFVAHATRTWRNRKACMGTSDQNAQMYMGGGEESSSYASLTIKGTALQLIGTQRGTDIDILRQIYGHVLAEADLEAIRTSGAGEFVGIFNNTVHRLRVDLTSDEQPYFIRANIAKTDTTSSS